MVNLTLLLTLAVWPPVTLYMLVVLRAVMGAPWRNAVPLALVGGLVTAVGMSLALAVFYWLLLTAWGF